MARSRQGVKRLDRCAAAASSPRPPVSNHTCWPTLAPTSSGSTGRAVAPPDVLARVDFCLMTLGGVMFAGFIPKAVGEGGQGRLLARYGNFYNGIEYKVADVADARRVCDERDIRVIQDSGGVFFTHPNSILGVLFEIFGGTSGSSTNHLDSGKTSNPSDSAAWPDWRWP
jgi:hypothetical protein